MRGKVFIWANSDLDGVASTILLGNMFSEFEYRSVFFSDFEVQYTKWAEDNLENWDKVFIIGIPLDQSLINRIDDYKIVFVSDMNEKLNIFDSSRIIEDTTSCCKLLYNRFKSKIEFPTNIKKFIAYVDDYNSQTLKFEETKYINALYRKSGSRKFTNFVNRFWKGFDGFSDRELNLANSYFLEIDKELSEIELYSGEFKGFKIISTFSKFPVNEIALKLFDKHETDIIIIVNLDTKFVSFRKSKNSKANIKFIAENLCQGGGGTFAGGGQITQKFLDFTTTLKPL